MTNQLRAVRITVHLAPIGPHCAEAITESINASPFAERAAVAYQAPDGGVSVAMTCEDTAAPGELAETFIRTVRERAAILAHNAKMVTLFTKRFKGAADTMRETLAATGAGKPN